MPTFLWITTMLLSWLLSSRMRACRSSYSRQSASVIPRKVAESRVSLCFRKSCRNSQQISAPSGQMVPITVLLAIAPKGRCPSLFSSCLRTYSRFCVFSTQPMNPTPIQRGVCSAGNLWRGWHPFIVTPRVRLQNFPKETRVGRGPRISVQPSESPPA